MESLYGDNQNSTSIPNFSQHQLVGQSYLMNQDRDSIAFRAHILEAIEEFNDIYVWNLT